MLVGPVDLPGHLKGVIRLHVTNFIRIMKREMCHDVTSGGIKVRKVVTHGFEADISDVVDEG